jgi:helix-turn-helix protein
MEKEKMMHPHPGNKVYRDQLVTLGDLQEFKDDLLNSIKTIIQNNAPQPVKKWLKSYEVKKLLNISTGTLQNLRANGTLPHTKIGGLIYYDTDELNKLLAGQKREIYRKPLRRHKKANS